MLFSTIFACSIILCYGKSSRLQIKRSIVAMKNKKIIYLIIVSLLFPHSAFACSIVGYIGQTLCKAFIEHGLSRLEYRGYDSAGFACLTPESNNLVIIKAEG